MQLTDSWPTVTSAMTDSRPTGTNAMTDSRPTVTNAMTDSRPTVTYVIDHLTFSNMVLETLVMTPFRDAAHALVQVTFAV
jgi:hypothetical protein